LQRWYFMSHKIEPEWKPYLKHILKESDMRAA